MSKRRKVRVVEQPLIGLGTGFGTGMFAAKLGNIAISRGTNVVSRYLSEKETCDAAADPDCGDQVQSK